VHDEVNESLFQHVMVLESEHVFNTFLFLILSFYIVGFLLGKSNKRTYSLSYKTWGHLNTDNGKIGNTGLPERRNSWGNRGIIVVVNLTMKNSRFFSSKRTLPSGLEKLEELIKNNKMDPFLINKSVIDIIADSEILMVAYIKIKSKPGNITSGINNETFDGINMEWFKSIASDILTGRFAFKPSRRVDIQKSNEGKRSLWVISPRDKIVQEVIRIILEAIFEPTFSNNSHGFRSGRGCHSALKQIHLTFGEVNWFVEGDITNCFDSFNHKRIISTVSDKIKDQVFIDLLYKSLKAGYIDISNNFNKLEVGTPQGSIISPILCNIYLDKLDKWIKNYILIFNKGIKKKQNPEYTKLTQGNTKRDPKERREIFKDIHENIIRQFIPNDPNYKRLWYVRYTNDLLVGIIGSKQDALDFKNNLNEFLINELSLTLSLDKTKITHSTTSRAIFLGTEIHITPYKKKPIRRLKRIGELRITKVSPRPQLSAPIDKIVQKLEERGYCKSLVKPTRIGKLIHYNLEIIIDHYLTVARGLLNYYSFVNNYARVRAQILYILKYSCALTFASKLKLKTLKKVFSKFGYNLSIKADNGKIIREFNENLFSKKATGFKIANYNPLSVIDLATKAVKRSKDSFGLPCTICGSTEKIEIHHIKHLKNIIKTTKNNYLLSIIVRINRKQVPLCQLCHNKVHRGKYDGPKL